MAYNVFSRTLNPTQSICNSSCNSSVAATLFSALFRVILRSTNNCHVVLCPPWHRILATPLKEDLMFFVVKNVTEGGGNI